MMSVYTIFDTRSESYSRPFCATCDGDAERILIDTAQDPKTSFHLHPEDFILFRCGSFDPSTGVIAPQSEYTNLGNVVHIATSSRSSKTLADHLIDLSVARGTK